MNANVSLAAFPGARYDEALHRALVLPVSEPALGKLSTRHVQLVPQTCREQLTRELAQEIARRFPDTQFRLHANVRVLEKHRLNADLSAFSENTDYFAELAAISRALNANGYSAHAGSREAGSFDDVLDAARRASDAFGCAVAVEGHYPTPREGNRWNVSSWAEYRSLFDSGVPYALDLSHLNIVGHHSRIYETNLVREMLACERCIEIHLSDNDGCGDQHRMLNIGPWWWALRAYFNTAAIVFSEGNQRKLAKLETP